jgi:hypothetical protein
MNKCQALHALQMMCEHACRLGTAVTTPVHALLCCCCYCQVTRKALTGPIGVRVHACRVRHAVTTHVSAAVRRDVKHVAQW